MIRRVLVFLLALLAGYAAMVVLITVVQEAMFGGISYHTTPLPQLLVAGALTTASAVAGGAVAARIFGKPWFPPALVMCGLVVLETSYMTLSNRLEGPLWFDLMAAGSLLFGICVGAYAVQRLQQSAAASAGISRDGDRRPDIRTGHSE